MFAKNTIWNLIYQLTAVIAGFLVPRAIIGVYGSEVNGLVTSLTQFIRSEEHTSELQSR